MSETRVWIVFDADGPNSIHFDEASARVVADMVKGRVVESPAFEDDDSVTVELRIEDRTTRNTEDRTEDS